MDDFLSMLEVLLSVLVDFLSVLEDFLSVLKDFLKLHDLKYQKKLHQTFADLIVGHILSFFRF